MSGSDSSIDPSLFTVEELYFQLASIVAYSQVLKKVGWPGLEVQRAVYHALQPCNHPFLVHQRFIQNLNEFVPPLSYQKAICRYLEKSVVYKQFRKSCGDDDAEYDDDFMEFCVNTINSCGYPSFNRDHCSGTATDGLGKSMLFSEEIEVDQVGYASYPVPFYYSMENGKNSSSFPPRIPILIKKTFHQVGTKVWGAGLFLAELFQYMAVEDYERRKQHGNHNLDENTSLFGGKTLFELGAGVGITGILLGRGLPCQYQPGKIVMTDCFEEVLKLMEYNISLLQSNSEGSPSCDLIGDYCDWSSEQSVLSEQLALYNPDFLFAADCTYSEDLNLLLISLFELYLSTNANENRGRIDCNDISSDVFLPTFLLKNNIKFILIACTIRHPDTFEHFQKHLRASPLLDAVDISDIAHQMIKDPLYLYDFRSRVRLFCIVKKSVFPE
jgi:hypothetical protein